MINLFSILKIRVLALVLAACLPVAVMAQEDAIVVSEATHRYWPVTDGDGNLCFKQQQQTTYLAERQGGVVQAGVFYGGTVKLNSSSGGFGNTARHQNAEQEGIFYDDLKLCYYNLQLARQGKKATASFERTFTDSRFFDCIFLDEEQPIRHKQVEVTLPSGYRLLERNLDSHISKRFSLNKQGDTVWCYTITDLPRRKDEPAMPSPLKTRPCLLVTGAFTDVTALYRWVHDLSGVDCAVASLDSLLATITQGCTTDEERMRQTFQWVQQHIRYIAYEAGMASYQPDTPANVLRLRWADCKGMALLLRTLLRAEGLDARLGFLGTDDIPWSPSEIPALTSLNHAICTVFLNGKTWFLDATMRYLSPGHVPDYLQGREVMVEHGDSLQLLTTPVLPPGSDCDSLRYEATIDGSRLHINATAAWSGDVREGMKRLIDNTEAKFKNECMGILLNGNDRHRAIRQFDWLTDSAEWTRLHAQLTDEQAVMHTGNECYVELDPHNDPSAGIIDTLKRTNDVEMPYRCRTVREVLLHIPEGYAVQWMPKGISISLPHATLDCSFELLQGAIRFRKVMEISDRHIRRSDIPQWNDALRRWHEAGSEQVILNTE